MSIWSQTRVALVTLLTLVGLLAVAFPALAAVSVSRAELAGTRLRVDGTAVPN